MSLNHYWDENKEMKKHMKPREAQYDFSQLFLRNYVT